MAEPTAQDLVRDLRRNGVTVSEIADVLQRSPRMVRKVLNGESSGALYRGALQELASTGRTDKIPPRRRSKDGSVVKIRGKRVDGEEHSVTPTDSGGRYTDAKQGGRVKFERGFMAEGGRMLEAKIPKGKTAKGRGIANQELLVNLRRAAQGQAGPNQKKVTTRVTFANGRIMEVKEYNASTMLKRINAAGGDALAWFAEAARDRYPNLDTLGTPITGLSFTITNEAKTQQYHDNAAAGHPKKTRSLTAAEREIRAARGGRP